MSYDYRKPQVASSILVTSSMSEWTLVHSDFLFALGLKTLLQRLGCLSQLFVSRGCTEKILKIFSFGIFTRTKKALQKSAFYTILPFYTFPQVHLYQRHT